MYLLDTRAAAKDLLYTHHFVALSCDLCSVFYVIYFLSRYVCV